MFTQPTASLNDHPTLSLVAAATLGFLIASCLAPSTVTDPTLASHFGETWADPVDTTRCTLKRPPALLASDIEAQAQPLSAESPTALLGEAIRAHDQGQPEKALAAWQQLAGYPELEYWRALGEGVALLNLGHPHEAEDRILHAVDLRPHHPAAHFFRARLKLELAADSIDYEDAVADSPFRLVSAVGKPQSRLLLEARQELELSVACQRNLDLDESLLKYDASFASCSTKTELTCDPLLTGLGADRLIGKSHGMLFHLYLDEEFPARAEFHLNLATEHDLMTYHDFRLLEELYVRLGQNEDADRVRATSRQRFGLVFLPPRQTTDLPWMCVGDTVASQDDTCH